MPAHLSPPPPHRIPFPAVQRVPLAGFVAGWCFHGGKCLRELFFPSTVFGMACGVLGGGKVPLTCGNYETCSACGGEGEVFLHGVWTVCRVCRGEGWTGG